MQCMQGIRLSLCMQTELLWWWIYEKKLVYKPAIWQTGRARQMLKELSLHTELIESECNMLTCNACRVYVCLSVCRLSSLSICLAHSPSVAAAIHRWQHCAPSRLGSVYKSPHSHHPFSLLPLLLQYSHTRDLGPWVQGRQEGISMYIQGLWAVGRVELKGWWRVPLLSYVSLIIHFVFTLRRSQLPFTVDSTAHLPGYRVCER
jgi:hypothetical protein